MPEGYFDPLIFKMDLYFIIHNSIYVYLENIIIYYYVSTLGEHYYLLICINEDAFSSSN